MPLIFRDLTRSIVEGVTFLASQTKDFDEERLSSSSFRLNERREASLFAASLGVSMESGSAYIESTSTVTASSSYPLVYIVPLFGTRGIFFLYCLSASLQS